MFRLFFSFLLLAGRTLSEGNLIPNRHIIELDEDHLIFARDGSPANIHKRMHITLESRGLKYQSNHDFGAPGLFVGMSITVRDPSDLQKLYDISGVKAVRPVERFKVPVPPVTTLATSTLAATNDSVRVNATDSLHADTGVAKLHAQGYTGKGIKIAIIDTGVDYNHPALGGGFGPGHKVIGGFDFTGDDVKKKKPDEDPMDCYGHGTHVAGIIGANPGTTPFNLKGVAYEAELMVYRVGGCVESIDEDATVAALLRADEDGNDVINLSVGGPGGWSAGRTWSIVAERIARKGRVLTISAGNEGENGGWYASSPAATDSVIAVGSVDAHVIPLQTVMVGGDVAHEPIMYFDVLPLTNNTDKPIPVYAPGNDSVFACKPLPKDAPNLAEYIVLIELSTACPRATQMKNIQAKGAKLALIWNAKKFSTVSETEDDIPVSMIQTTDGAFIAKQLEAKKKVTLTFPKGGALTNYEIPTGGLMSSFSSYGPTFDFRFKPAISGPGGSIVSTIPVNQGGYGIKSGTSMSAPYIAGCAALLLQARGKTPEVARQARDLFESTAVPVAANRSSEKIPLLQTVTSAGAGYVDVFSAAFTETVVGPGELVLNDTKYFKGIHELTVRNVGKVQKKYSVDHFPAGTVVTVKPGTIQMSAGPVPLVEAYATVDLSTTSFTLAPNETKTITAKFTPPKGLDPTTLPVYSGFIQVEAEGEGEMGLFHVSYLGVVGTLFDQQVLDNTNQLFGGLNLPAIIADETSNGNYTVQVKENTYEFKGNEKFPRLFYRLAFGSPKVDVDLVSPSLNLENLPSPVPVIGHLSNRTFVTRHKMAKEVNTGFASILLNNNATFSNLTYVPSGTYKVLIRALRVTGDPGNPDHYDKWLSPTMTLRFTSRRGSNLGDEESDELEKAGKPIYQRTWFIVVMSVAALLVVGAVAAGAFVLSRRRKSTIRSEAGFVPPMGAYKPLVDETREHEVYSSTAYRPAS
ncbi:subtilisin-like protein [Marasmius fiardii PR-910]|nr:subtilisin-like protein [Marasmius fiardii PR-910]